jgi:hypothetical protein
MRDASAAFLFLKGSIFDSRVVPTAFTSWFVTASIFFTAAASVTLNVW